MVYQIIFFLLNTDKLNFLLLLDGWRGENISEKNLSLTERLSRALLVLNIVFNYQTISQTARVSVHPHFKFPSNPMMIMQRKTINQCVALVCLGNSIPTAPPSTANSRESA